MTVHPERTTRLPDEGETRACPECDDPQVQSHNGSIQARDPREGWYCQACGAQFAKPVVRERRADSAVTTGVAADLVAADPDDYVADGGRPQHRADCEDCAWSFRSGVFAEVSDRAERHARKEVGHDVDIQRAVVTDGGVSRRRFVREAVDGIRTHAGVGDQDTTCVNDTPGCPGPDAEGGMLPCFDCIVAGGEDER